VFRPSSADRAWVDAFTSWLEQGVRDGDTAALLAAMQEAPEAVRNHPTDEHLLPFYFALGAGGGHGERLHHSYTYGVLAMDAYAFGATDPVQRLAA
jgi:4,5-DOPA dioxygenase extradiol